MDALIETYGVVVIAGAFLVAALGGFTKGAVGFALPMIMVSGVGSMLPAHLTIAAIILASLTTNLWQALRQGLGEALGSLVKHWRLNAVMLVVVALSAQLVSVLPDRTLFLILGAGVTVFSLIQLSGWKPPDPGADVRVESGVGLIAGFFGGLAGVWGPPLVLYLLARRTAKYEMVRVQGITYLLGSVVLIAAHGRSGLLSSQTAGFSALMIVPAMLGMWLGLRLQDRMPQEGFRRATMAVLALAGLNLLRRGLAG